ncbi:MAG: hypothetical protein LBB93_01035, partial [Elusimicrobiota bacterium]|nr:hypothetical protein [Elusimicrobiota bacterium]
MKKILTICLAFLLFACSSTYQIDMTSKDSMNSSIEQIEKSLPVKKREAFKEALSVIVIAAAFGLI